MSRLLAYIYRHPGARRSEVRAFVQSLPSELLIIEEDRDAVDQMITYFVKRGLIEEKDGRLLLTNNVPRPLINVARKINKNCKL